jgi:hypothetical protein
MSYLPEAVMVLIPACGASEVELGVTEVVGVEVVGSEVPSEVVGTEVVPWDEVALGTSDEATLEFVLPQAVNASRDAANAKTAIFFCIFLEGFTKVLLANRPNIGLLS